MARFNALRSTAGLVSSTEFHQKLAKTFDRSPTTMRKLTANIEPKGHSIESGRLAYYYDKAQVVEVTKHFKKNPPKGSGRPKGTSKKKEASK